MLNQTKVAHIYKLEIYVANLEIAQLIGTFVFSHQENIYCLTFIVYYCKLNVSICIYEDITYHILHVL